MPNAPAAGVAPRHCPARPRTASAIVVVTIGWALAAGCTAPGDGGAVGPSRDAVDSAADANGADGLVDTTATDTRHVQALDAGKSEPRLVVAQLKPVPHGYRAGHPLQVQVVIRNDGDAIAPAAPITLQVRVGGAVGEAVTILRPALEVGAHHVVDVQLSTPSDSGQAHVVLKMKSGIVATALVAASATNLGSLSVVPEAGGVRVTATDIAKNSDGHFRWLASADPHLSADDVVVSDGLLKDVMASNSALLQPPAPAQMSARATTCFLALDPNNDIVELDKSDNVAAVPCKGSRPWPWAATASTTGCVGADCRLVTVHVRNQALAVTVQGGVAQAAADKPFLHPVRDTVVHALDATGKTVAAGVTDSAGTVVMSVPIATSLQLAVQAVGVAPNGCVEDGPVAAVVGLGDSAGAFFPHEVVVPLPMPATGVAAQVTVPLVERKSAPLHILDAVLAGYRAMCAWRIGAVNRGLQVAPLRPVRVDWGPQRTGQGPQQSANFVGPAHYSLGSAVDLADPGTIHLRGDIKHNTDEWDRSLVLHELAHHFTSTTLRSDSPGGPHPVGFLDPALACAEGIANFFATWVSKSPLLVDTLAPDVPSPVLDWSAPPVGVDRGTYSERSVSWLLWNVFATQADDLLDTLAVALQQTPQPLDLLVLAHKLTTTASKKSIESAWSQLDTPLQALTDPAIAAAHYAKTRAFTAPGLAVAAEQPISFWLPYRWMAPGAPRWTPHETLLPVGLGARRRVLFEAVSDWTRIAVFAGVDELHCDRPLRARLLGLQAGRLVEVHRASADVATARCAVIQAPTTTGDTYVLEVSLAAPVAPPQSIPFRVSIY